MRTTAAVLKEASALRRAATSLASRARVERAGELTLTQVAVLGRIAVDGPITPREVAGRLRMVPQSLTRPLAALEAAGLVRRTPDPSDGRGALLHVTGDGLTALRAEMAPRDRWLARATAALTMVAVLGALGSTLVLRDHGGASDLNPVLAVVLVLTSSRFAHDSVRDRFTAAGEVVLLAPAATGVGWLIVHQEALGQTLLVLGLSLGIYTRRFGPLVRKAGRMIALPFLALLVAPVPVPVAGSGGFGSVLLWSPVTAGIALAWSTAVAVLADRGRSDSPSSPPVRRSRRRLDAPTRMALQTAAALGAACALGHLL